MCNINALYVKNKKGDITPFLMSVTSHSYVNNSHGEGIYISSSNEVIKSKEKIDYFKYKDKLENSNLIITHQRFSTSGFEVKYNHPFENEDFILVHNGVINQFKENEGSDTFGFFNKFYKEFREFKVHTTREYRIVRMIKKLLQNCTGSYSILLYDKKMDISYYFKNSPEINFYLNDNYLFITTESDNSIFLSLIDNEKFKIIDIKPLEIYRIVVNDKPRVFHIDDIPETKIEEIPAKVYSGQYKWGSIWH